MSVNNRDLLIDFSIHETPGPGPGHGMNMIEPVNEHLIEFFNRTLNNSHSDLIYKKITENIYNSSAEESKYQIFILVTILITFSIFGSLSNLLVVFVFNFNFDFNRKRIKYSNKRRKKASIPNQNHQQQQQQQQHIQLNENQQNVPVAPLVIAQATTNDQYNSSTINFLKQHITHQNSNLHFFYSLIKYLAIIDLFTCSVAIPATVYEIWHVSRINEIACKLFEQFRATGVIASNFFIILIAIERYIALYKLNFAQRFKLKPFQIRLALVIFTSVLIGLIDMLQVSVYQKINEYTIYIGICMSSEVTFSFAISKILRVTTTFLFIIGSFVVLIFYVLIFKRTFELNKRRETRKQKENEIKKNARTNSLFTATTTASSVPQQELMNHLNEFLREKESNEKKSILYKLTHLNRNLRIAIMIFLVTFLYYLSVIPWCLTMNSVIKYNPFIYYTFLLNNTLNPLIYGFFNPYFRNCCIYLFKTFLNGLSSRFRTMFRR